MALGVSFLEVVCLSLLTTFSLFHLIATVVNSTRNSYLYLINMKTVPFVCKKSTNLMIITSNTGVTVTITFHNKKIIISNLTSINNKTILIKRKLKKRVKLCKPLATINSTWLVYNNG